MNISFYFKNLEPTEALKDYAREKLSKLNDRLHHIESVDVRFSLLKQLQTFEVTVHADATVFHLRKSEKDMYAAIDVTVDVLFKQIERYRTKLESKTAVTDKFDLIPQSPEASDEDITISVYDAPVKPMSDEEAVLQLRANRFQFLMYHTENQNRYSVVLARPDGNYSIINPKDNDPGQYTETVFRLKGTELDRLSQSVYPMSRLSISEAIDHIVETSSPYFVYVNDESGRMNLLFRGKNAELILKKPAD